MKNLRLATACLLAATASAAATAPAAAALPPPPGTIRIVSFVAGSPTLDDVPVESSAAVEVAAGSHIVRVGDASLEVEVGPSCAVLAVVYLANGPTAPASIDTTSECPTPRAPQGATATRLVVATAPRSVPDGLDARIGSITLHAAPDKPSGRIDIPSRVKARVDVLMDGDVIRTEQASLPAGHAVTLVFGGGGETPAHLVVLDDGSQTDTEPPTHGPPTGRPASPADSDLAPVAIAAAVVGAAWLLRNHLKTLSLAALLCAASCSAEGAQPAATHLSTPAATARSTPTTAVSPQTWVASAIEIRGEELPIVALPPNSDLLRTLRDPTVAMLGTADSDGGNTVLAAHVSWGKRPGAFAAVVELHLGETVTITDTTGVTHDYIIDGALQRPKTDPWLAAWSPTAISGIYLVTCAGAVDPQTQLHLDNLWVHAKAAT